MASIIEQRTEYLLRNPHFLAFAIQGCRNVGLRVPVGDDPRRVLLSELYSQAPHEFETFVSRATEASESAAPKPSAEQTATRERFAADLPAEAVLRAWKKLPADSSIRERARTPELDAFAKASLARSGLSPLPGLTEGETVAAYLHAVNTTPALSSNLRVFDDLATATGGAFGDAATLRGSARKLQKLHTEQESKRELAEWSAAINKRVDERDQGLRSGRAVPLPKGVRKDPTVDRGREANNQFRKNLRETVANAYDDLAAEGGPEKKVVNNRDKLFGEIGYRRAAGESFDDLEIGPELRSELTREAREQGYRVEEVPGSE